MKITERAVEVKFEDRAEAARFLGAYAGDHRTGLAGGEFQHLLTASVETRKAAATEAARLLAEHFNVTPPFSAGPTYIPGSTPGMFHDIRTMPTRYIQNVLRLPSVRMAAGLVRELKAELARRDESA